MAIQALVRNRFPDGIAEGFKRREEWRTKLIELANGREKRVIERGRPRFYWECEHAVKDITETEELIHFFGMVRGSGCVFPFKDWLDYELAGEVIGTGDGVKTTCQITKTYAVAHANRWVRPIQWPVLGTLSVTVGGVPLTEGAGFLCDYDTGNLTFAAPPTDGAEIVVSGEYDVPCRLENDVMETELETWVARHWRDIVIREVWL